MRKVGRIIALQPVSVAADGKARIERKSCLCDGLRFVLCPQHSESSGKDKMSDGIIAVGLKATTQPYDCFSVGAELQLGKAGKMRPSVGEDVARRQAKRLADTLLSFLTTPDKYRGKTDSAMSLG